MSRFHLKSTNFFKNNPVSILFTLHYFQPDYFLSYQRLSFMLQGHFIHKIVRNFIISFSLTLFYGKNFDHPGLKSLTITNLSHY